MSAGNSGKLWSPVGEKIHLDRLRWNPKSGHIEFSLSKKERIADLFPMKVPSSKYHTEKATPSIHPTITTRERGEGLEDLLC